MERKKRLGGPQRKIQRLLISLSLLLSRTRSQAFTASMLSARSCSPFEPWGPAIDRRLIGSDWTWVDNFLCCIRVHYWPTPRKAIDILKKREDEKEHRSWKSCLLQQMICQQRLLELYDRLHVADEKQQKGSSIVSPSFLMLNKVWISLGAVLLPPPADSPKSTCSPESLCFKVEWLLFLNMGRWGDGEGASQRRIIGINTKEPWNTSLSKGIIFPI